jgi:hypothetical protein
LGKCEAGAFALPLVTPRSAGIRLILLSLPFLAFGLLWALRPPMEGALGDATSVLRGLGVAMAVVGAAAVVGGAVLVGRGEGKTL